MFDFNLDIRDYLAFRAIVGSINLAPGSFDDRRELAIETHDDEIVERLHKVAHTTGITRTTRWILQMKGCLPTWKNGSRMVSAPNNSGSWEMIKQ